MSESSSHLNRDVGICLLLAVAVLGVYWQTLDHDFVQFDDHDYVTQNEQVLGGLTWEGVRWALSATRSGNWHPLTWLSHMVDVQLFGLDAGGHHFTSVWLHLVNSLLVYLVFKRMTGATWRCAFVAGLFALHPLHVESVAWVSERKDVLSTLLWLMTMGCYTRYVEKPSRGRYGTVVAMFALGLMAKPMLVTLPFVLLLMDYWPLKRFEDLRDAGRLLVEKIPLFLLAGISCVVTFVVQQQGGAVRSLEAIALEARCANAMVSTVAYLGKMLYPVDLAVLYPHPGSVPWWQAGGAAILLAAVTGLAIKWLRTRPFFAVGWFWFLGTLVPVIGLVQVGLHAMADRYTYVPLIGIFVILAWGIPEGVVKLRRRRRFLVAGGAGVLVACMLVSRAQVAHWRDSETLFEHTLAVTTENYLVHTNFGGFLFLKGDREGALRHFREAARIKPEIASLHYNVGGVLESLGHEAEAVESYRRARELLRRDTESD